MARRWLSGVSSARVEPSVPLFLGVHGLASGLVIPTPWPALVAFGGVAALGAAGLLGWRSPRAAAIRALTVLSVGLGVQLLEPDLVTSMLQWYYCVPAVYGLLLTGRVAALMGPAAAGCYLLQVAFGVGAVPWEMAGLRAAVLVALGLTMYVAGRSYRFERDTAEAGRVAAQTAGRALEHAATHDALTGLANRTLFLQELSATVAARPSGELAVMVLDVDRFATVNDTFGHDVGDQLLVDIASRLELVAGPGLVARLGGDEFAVLHVTDDGPQVEDIARRIQESVEAPYAVHDREHRITLSIGVANHTATPGGATDLLRAAKVAVHDAKSSGRSRIALYRPAMAEQAVRALTLEQQLGRAVRDRDISLAYQPIVDLTSGRLRGVEALARWTLPDGTTVAPDVFIPIAEEIGLIEDLGRHVLAGSLAALQRWRQAGLDVGSVAVNASPIQLQNPDFGESVRHLLQAHRLEPSDLTLEITEGAVMQASPVVLSTLDGLRALGVGISMDDFGTGYSSLSRLRHLPVTELKIDRSFVEELKLDDTFTRLVLSLARSLGVHTVAEGVETRHQLQTLRGLGADAAQGYLIARPMIETDLALFPLASPRPVTAP